MWGRVGGTPGRRRRVPTYRFCASPHLQNPTRMRMGCTHTHTSVLAFCAFLMSRIAEIRRAVRLPPPQEKGFEWRSPSSQLLIAHVRNGALHCWDEAWKTGRTLQPAVHFSGYDGSRARPRFEGPCQPRLGGLCRPPSPPLLPLQCQSQGRRPSLLPAFRLQSGTGSMYLVSSARGV